MEKEMRKPTIRLSDRLLQISPNAKPNEASNVTAGNELNTMATMDPNNRTVDELKNFKRDPSEQDIMCESFDYKLEQSTIIRAQESNFF